MRSATCLGPSRRRRSRRYPHPGRTLGSHSSVRSPFRPVPGRGELRSGGLCVESVFICLADPVARGVLRLARRGGTFRCGRHRVVPLGGSCSMGLGLISLYPPRSLRPAPRRARRGLGEVCGGLVGVYDPCWALVREKEAVDHCQTLEGASLSPLSPFRDWLSYPPGSRRSRKGLGHAAAGQGGLSRSPVFMGCCQSQICFMFLSGR